MLVQLPSYTDNYIYVLHDGSAAVVVDPGDADVVTAFLDAEGLSLAAVLNTHHHFDHVTGNDALVAATGCAVYGAAHDQARIPGCTHPVTPGETVVPGVAGGLVFDVLDVAAHTTGHIAWVTRAAVDTLHRRDHVGRTAVQRMDAPVAFVGDALFAAGCGRLFEGTAAQLASAMQTLAALPGTTWMACAHEYTASNLAFAAHVAPENAAILARAAGLDALRVAQGSSVPCLLAEEHATNPFLRAVEPAGAEVDAVLGLTAPSAAERAGALRAAKDAF